MGQLHSNISDFSPIRAMDVGVLNVMKPLSKQAHIELLRLSCSAGR